MKFRTFGRFSASHFVDMSETPGPSTRPRIRLTREQVLRRLGLSASGNDPESDEEHPCVQEVEEDFDEEADDSDTPASRLVHAATQVRTHP